MPPALAPPATAPRRAQHVARLTVHAGAGSADAAPWRQRVEDALRCGPLAGGHRLLLLRRLRVHASAAEVHAGGAAWQAQVDAACRDAASRACPALSPGAAHADAVWFDDWDTAVAAGLDHLLALSTTPSAPPWVWARVLRLAGVYSHTAADGAAPAHSGPQDPDAMAQALWQAWQADPASARAGRQWLAARPGAARRLGLMAPVAHPPSADRPPADPGETVAPVHPTTPAVGTRADRPDRNDGAAATAAPPADRAMRAAVSDAPSPVPADTGRRADRDDHRDADAPLSRDAVQTANGTDPPAPRAATHTVHAPAPPASTRRPDDPAPTTAHAPPPTHAAPAAASTTHALRRTAMAGLPLTITALERLGFGAAWAAVADAQPDAAGRALAGSAPWLWAWSRLDAPARRSALADPMWAALPVAEWWPTPDADAWAARWRAAPPAVRALGARAGRALAAHARHTGHPMPRALLQRAGGLRLDTTHLDVVFRLDDADLAVRRHGLDGDPGWVPWFGRIVHLHFQPTLPWDDLP